MLQVPGHSVFFFFKQKTAYEMLRSLVGSEMCIRDRLGGVLHRAHHAEHDRVDGLEVAGVGCQLDADLLLSLIHI